MGSKFDLDDLALSTFKGHEAAMNLELSKLDEDVRGEINEKDERRS